MIEKMVLSTDTNRGYVRRGWGISKNPKAMHLVPIPLLTFLIEIHLKKVFMIIFNGIHSKRYYVHCFPTGYYM